MKSLILGTATRLLLPLMLIFSVFLLLRGHNAPGGGFVGGLVAAAGFALVLVAFGVDAARRALRIRPRILLLLGLSIALVSALMPVAFGLPFMTGLWLVEPLPVVGKVGTPVLFDAGVYLLVLGISLGIVFRLAEER